MCGPNTTFHRLIETARTNSEVLGDLLTQYRGLLRIIAAHEIGRSLGRRVDASDVVQQTFLDAQRGFEGFTGAGEPELTGWLKKILQCNIADEVRRHKAVKRDTRREQSPYFETDSALIKLREPEADQSTASQRAVRGEQAIRLAQILDELPEDQREAVTLRHFEGWSLDEIAEAMGRTYAAAAGLVKRGMAALGRKMSEESWSF